METTLKINKDDISEEIKDFPLEVVQKMVELTMKEEHINAEEALKILRNDPCCGFTCQKQMKELTSGTKS